MIRYADNAILITENARDTQRAINKVKETLKIFKIKINIKKTKLLLCTLFGKL